MGSQFKIIHYKVKTYKITIQIQITKFKISCLIVKYLRFYLEIFGKMKKIEGLFFCRFHNVLNFALILMHYSKTFQVINNVYLKWFVRSEVPEKRNHYHALKLNF